MLVLANHEACLVPAFIPTTLFYDGIVAQTHYLVVLTVVVIVIAGIVVTRVGYTRIVFFCKVRDIA